MNANTFLPDLQTLVNTQIVIAQNEFAPRGLQDLNYKPGTDSWSILECLEHLNRYCRYYLPLLQKAISGAPQAKPDQNIRYSFLGKYSIDMVRPANVKKHKTLKHMNPNNSLLTLEVLEEFLRHQQTLLTLLSKAASADLNRKTIPIEFMRLLKMRTGEALEFLVQHQQRHIGQAQRVLSKLPKPGNGVLVV